MKILDRFVPLGCSMIQIPISKASSGVTSWTPMHLSIRFYNKLKLQIFERLEYIKKLEVNQEYSLPSASNDAVHGSCCLIFTLSGLIIFK